jgi:hypothetical protein
MEKAIKNLFYSLTVFASLAAVVAIVFAFAWSHLPSHDPDSYFQFADRRIFLGIPNFFDVTSNLFFIYCSLYGFYIYLTKSEKNRQAFWLPFLVMNIGILLTAAGSSYFHLLVTRESLFWDRLPMALIFGSMVTMIFADRVNPAGSKFFLVVLNLLTTWTVWNLNYGNGSIKPYLIAQFGCVLTLLLLAIFFNYGRLSRVHLLAAAVIYGLAKFLEMHDHQVFAALGTMGGHTLKHMAAAGALLVINSGVKQEPWRPYKR